MINDDAARYLALALETARMAVWDSRLEHDTVVESDVIWRDWGACLLGLQPVPTSQPFIAFIAAVHPEDRAYITTTMQTAVENIGGYEIE